MDTGCHVAIKWRQGPSHEFLTLDYCHTHVTNLGWLRCLHGDGHIHNYQLILVHDQHLVFQIFHIGDPLKDPSALFNVDSG